MKNLVFYKEFETRMQELKQIWNEIRSNGPKEVATEELGKLCKGPFINYVTQLRWVGDL